VSHAPSKNTLTFDDYSIADLKEIVICHHVSSTWIHQLISHMPMCVQIVNVHLLPKLIGHLGRNKYMEMGMDDIYRGQMLIIATLNQEVNDGSRDACFLLPITLLVASLDKEV
jgi:hypothetical protein